MNAARYYYSQDAIELIIVKIEPSDDDPYYEIKTKKLVKKYIFWGDLVDKLESVYAGYDDKYLVELAKPVTIFCTLVSSIIYRSI